MAKFLQLLKCQERYHVPLIYLSSSDSQVHLSHSATGYKNTEFLIAKALLAVSCNRADAHISHLLTQHVEYVCMYIVPIGGWQPNSRATKSMDFLLQDGQ